ncbi:MAG: outer membrane beta-barrel protein [Candidatus Omnitrophica bacterium]|nr:outer membrane beta-barrel protein [Candidatus Omnitrophota bacterium]
MGGCCFFSSYAEVSRQELISYSLDYYTLKDKAEQKQQEEKKIQEVKTVELKVKQQKRLDKVKGFLDNFHLYAETKVSFNDNIYLTESDTAEDIITEITPGIKYENFSKQKRLRILLDGGIRFKNYVQENQHDTGNPYGNFVFSYGLGRMSFDLENDYKKDQSEVSQITTGSQGDLIDYRQNRTKAKVNLDLNRLAWDFWYSHFFRTYDRGRHQLTGNYDEDFIGIAGAWKVFPKTLIFLEYDHRWLDYFKGGKLDRNYDMYWIGVKGDIFTKLKGVAKAGYEQGHYEDESTKSGSTVSLNLNYQASPRITYDLTIERSIGDAEIDNQVSDGTQKYTLLCNYLPPFNKKLRLSAGAAYGFNEYESSREDNAYSLKFLSEYELRSWLKLTGEYEFNKLVSTENAAEYNNNILSLKLISEF